MWLLAAATCETSLAYDAHMKIVGYEKSSRHYLTYYFCEELDKEIMYSLTLCPCSNW